MASTPIAHMCPSSLCFTPHSMSRLLACLWWQRSECANFRFRILQPACTTAIVSPASHIAQHTVQSAQYTSMQKTIRSQFPRQSVTEVEN